MAKSEYVDDFCFCFMARELIIRYEYTRLFEQVDTILPNTWLIVRIDGRGFHKLSEQYVWSKPNDSRALKLMNLAASEVMVQLPDMLLAYGQSDEFSFVLHPTSQLYDRRGAKLVSAVVSIFTGLYILKWQEVMGTDFQAGPLPSFDGRAVAYPSLKNMRDYLAWRQVDCHINNLYNTTFWTLVDKGGRSRTKAEQELSGTLSADKHEILHGSFGINYNEEPAMFRKGTCIYRDFYLPEPKASKVEEAHQSSPRPRARIGLGSVDIIGDGFWKQHPWLLAEPGTERKRILQKFFDTSKSTEAVESTVEKLQIDGEPS